MAFLLLILIILYVVKINRQIIKTIAKTITMEWQPFLVQIYTKQNFELLFNLLYSIGLIYPIEL